MRNFRAHLSFSLICSLFLLSGKSFAMSGSYQSIATAKVAQSFTICLLGGCDTEAYQPPAGAVCKIAYQGWVEGSCFLDNDSNTSFGPVIKQGDAWYVRAVETSASGAIIQLVRPPTSTLSCPQGMVIACTGSSATWADVNTGLSGYLSFSKTDGALANYCAPDPLFGYPSTQGKDECGYEPVSFDPAAAQSSR